MSASKHPGRVKKTLQADVVDEVLRMDRERIRASICNVLVVIAGPEVGQRVVVDRTVTIGRHPDCDLVLTDPLISSFHVRVEDRGDSWTLVDLGSTNGTRVNGERKTEVALEQGDKVGLGKTVIRYESQDHDEQEYAAQLEQLLTKDDLSGLFVRRKFDTELARATQSAAATGSSVSLLVMDLDGIKKINDTHGHLFGAFVIGESGRLIGEVVGERGFACRFGGDEFLAALPGLDAGAAGSVAEEIRSAINDHHFERSGVELKPGISIGVAAFPHHAADPVSLFEKGDEALYRAKSAGKNCVRGALAPDTS